jgi:hypothetical protein
MTDDLSDYGLILSPWVGRLSVGQAIHLRTGLALFHRIYTSSLVHMSSGVWLLCLLLIVSCFHVTASMYASLRFV